MNIPSSLPVTTIGLPTRVDCSIHGLNSPGFFGQKGPRCGECVAAEIEANRNRIASAARQVANCGVPALYQGASYSDSDTSGSWPEECVAKVKRWGATCDRERGCLVIVGGTGTGKSRLAAALTIDLARRQISALFASQNSYLTAIHDAWDDREAREAAVRQAHLSPRVLVLDDVGAAVANENDTMRIAALIDARYVAMLPTVVVSNLRGGDVPKDAKPEEARQYLKVAMGARAYDRIREASTFVVLDAKKSRRAPA